MMAKIHYNHYIGELRSPVEQKEYLKPIHNNVIYKAISEDAMFNLLEHYLLYNMREHHIIRVKPRMYKGGSKLQYNNDESSNIWKLDIEMEHSLAQLSS